MEKDKLEEAYKTFNEQDKLVVNQTQTVASINVQNENILQILPNLRLEENKIAILHDIILSFQAEFSCISKSGF